MSLPTGAPLETQSLEAPSVVDASASPSASAYLFVLDGSSCYRHPLPREGMLVVGRSPDTGIHIDDEAVSRHHARLSVADGEVQITDLGSHNGTLVNGERVEGPRALCSGDVVAVGSATLVLRREPRPLCRSALDATRLRQRLEEELDRALGYARPLGVAVVSLGDFRDRAAAGAKAAATLRLMDAFGWLDGASDLVAVLPELGGKAACAAAQELVHALASLSAEARGGLATCPFDGCDVETLLSGARAAAAVAAAGAVALAAETTVQHVIGDQTIVAADPAMIRLYNLVRRLAASDLPVLVLGETGAGKENAAAAVHYWSARAERRLVTLNCAAIPEALIESELFGYEKGAFSDARAPKPGLLEQASGGTVFLDEIGELPLSAQAKLLRALEQKRITRLGDVREREIDLRVVAATNRDLEADGRAGRFRHDLLFRLSAAVVELPPLRHRPREVPILARVFLAGARAPAGRPAPELSEAALYKLAAYPWPGNVRELKNAMEFAAATADSSLIEPWNLPERVTGRSSPPPSPAGADAEPAAAPEASSPGAAPRRFRPIAEELHELERARILEALEATSGVQTRAAELISMPLRTFALKLKQYGISVRDVKRRQG